MSELRSDADILRDAYSPEHRDKIAPVQGYGAGIPWSMHLEAYDAYSKKWSPQPALIDLKERGCRGGFSTGELDMFIPGWRDRVGEIAELRARLAAAEALLTQERELVTKVEAAIKEWAYQTACAHEDKVMRAGDAVVTAVRALLDSGDKA